MQIYYYKNMNASETEIIHLNVVYKLWNNSGCGWVRDWEDYLETFWGESLRKREGQVRPCPVPHLPSLKPDLNHEVAVNPCHIGSNALHLLLKALTQLLNGAS